MVDCIFCKIAKGEIPANIIYEDDETIAFYDIEPQAPVHFLVIPKRHHENILAINRNDNKLLLNIFNTIEKVGKQLNLDQNGFRIVNNMGDQGGQTVGHLHFHILGGRQMSWPPG